VAVVGGGDSALTEALFLARLAGEVFLIHRRDQFRAVRALQERVLAEPRVKALPPAVVKSIEGEDEVKRLILAAPREGGGRTGEKEAAQPGGVRPALPGELAVDGVFIYVGTDPATGYCADQVQLDDSGYVIADEGMRTSADGVFAAGDVRHKGLRQIVTACSDGAIAAMSCEAWLAERGLIR
jgi:thioredoxin reductase (NADPH)